MLTLWKSIVIPRLEYCCQVWNPQSVGDIQSLEMIQRSFTRKITGTKDLTYWETLKHLKLYSLQRRRERYIIIYTWKMIENIVPNINNDTSMISTYNQNRKGRLCKIPAVLPSIVPTRYCTLTYNNSISGSTAIQRDTRRYKGYL